jgi:hypothetical protein
VVCTGLPCAIGMCRETVPDESREGEAVFNFIRRVRTGGVPSGNFESNWLSDHRLRKQMSVDFVGGSRRRRSARCP